MNNSTFRIAKSADANAIMVVIEEGRGFLKAQGIDQWQNGYPDADVIGADIAAGQGYVMEGPDGICAYAALCLGGDEPDYREIHGGAWLTPQDAPYAAMHRVALAAACRGTGLASAFFAQLAAVAKQKGVPSIRVDTHRQNLPMQRFLQKQGFAHTGTIYLVDPVHKGAERVAFERLL